jgi:hypothetical protein
MDRETRIRLLVEETGMPHETAKRVVDLDDEDIQRQVDEIIAARERREEAVESLGRRAERILATR